MSAYRSGAILEQQPATVQPDFEIDVPAVVVQAEPERENATDLRLYGAMMLALSVGLVAGLLVFSLTS